MISDMLPNVSSFHVIDWAIMLGYLVLSMGLALFFSVRAKTMKEFVCAGQNVGFFLGTTSLIGTEMGLITIMYSAQKGFSGGFAAFHIAFIAGLVTLLVGISGFIVAPLRALNVLTIPEFYEKRFGKSVRILGGILLSVGGILNMGLFLKVGAMFFIGITGISTTLLPYIMASFIVLVIAYTCFGGMWTVIITDFIQFCVLAVGLIISVVLAINRFSWASITQTLLEHKGLAGFDPFLADAGFGFSYVLWMIVTAGLVSCAIWPTAVARALSMKNSAMVKKQYRYSSLFFMARFLVPYFLGACAFVYCVTVRPEIFPLFETGQLSSLYALPIFLKALLPVGLLGLLSAGMLAAFMSTHDSYLLCWSSVITQDIINPLFKNRLSETVKLQLTRLIIILVGSYIWYWGMIYEGSEDIWDYMAITGAIYFTGAISVLIGGLYWKKASKTGALWALCAGFSAVMGLSPVQHFFKLTTISSAQIGLATLVFTCTAFILGSLIFPDKGSLIIQEHHT